MNTKVLSIRVAMALLAAAGFAAYGALALPVHADDDAEASSTVHMEVKVSTEHGTTTVEVQSETHASATSTEHKSEGKDEGKSDDSNDDSATTTKEKEDSHGSEVSSERNKGQQGSAMATEHSSENSEASEHAGKQEFDRDSDEMQATSTKKIEDASKVRSDDDLSGFSASVFEHNKHVTHLTLSTTSVSTDFKSPAKLLGFIPVSIPARVEVSHEGEVHVAFPWYALLFATGGDELQQTVASSTEKTGIGATVSLSAKQQATLVQSILSAIQNFFGASVSGSASAQ